MQERLPWPLVLSLIWAAAVIVGAFVLVALAS